MTSNKKALDLFLTNLHNPNNIMIMVKVKQHRIFPINEINFTFFNNIKDTIDYEHRVCPIGHDEVFSEICTNTVDDYLNKMDIPYPQVDKIIVLNVSEDTFDASVIVLHEKNK